MRRLVGGDSPVDEAGPMTFTVTVDNDKPFWMVLTAPSA